MVSSSAAIGRMDSLIRQDFGGRGLASKAGPNPLQAAAESLAGAERVLIATGFCVRAFMIGETDGPPGAAILADVLTGLGAEVGIVTDRHSVALVRSACEVYGRALPVFEVPLGQDEADAFLLRLVAEFRPTHIIAIERPGSAADGTRYSMRGESLDDLVPGLDLLFGSGAAGMTLPWTTVAVGDGGNELGMGSLPFSLRAGVEHGERIFAARGADFPIVAGVSNWGGWALAAATLLAAGARENAEGRGVGAADGLRDAAMEAEVLGRIVGLGAVDGATKTRGLTVDGLSLETYLEVIRGVHAAYREALS